MKLVVLCLLGMMCAALAAPGALQPAQLEVGTVVNSKATIIGDMGSSGTRLSIAYEGKLVIDMSHNDGRCTQGKNLDRSDYEKMVACCPENPMCQAVLADSGVKYTSAMSSIFFKFPPTSYACVLDIVMGKLAEDCAAGLVTAGSKHSEQVLPEFRGKDASWAKKLIAQASWKIYATAGMRLVDGASANGKTFFAAVKTASENARKHLNGDNTDGITTTVEGKIVAGNFEGVFGFLAATNGLSAEDRKGVVYMEYGGASEQIVFETESVAQFGSFAEIQATTGGYMDTKSFKGFSHSYLGMGQNRLSLHALHLCVKEAADKSTSGIIQAECPCFYTDVTLEGKIESQKPVFRYEKTKWIKHKDLAKSDPSTSSINDDILDQLNNKNWGQTHETAGLREFAKRGFKAKGKINWAKCVERVSSIYLNHNDETSSAHGKSKAVPFKKQLNAIHKAFSTKSTFKSSSKKLVLINSSSVSKKDPVNAAEIIADLKTFCPGHSATADKPTAAFYVMKSKVNRCLIAAQIYFNLFHDQGELRLPKDGPANFKKAGSEWALGASIYLGQDTKIDAYNFDVEKHEFKTVKTVQSQSQAGVGAGSPSSTV